MKRIVWQCALIGMVSCLALVGCGAEKTTSAKEAIEIAKSMETVEEKITYLIQQAETFYDSEQFQQAIDTAQYVLQYLDEDSQAAKNLIEKAKSALAAAAKEAVEDVEKKVEVDLGK